MKATLVLAAIAAAAIGAYIYFSRRAAAQTRSALNPPAQRPAVAPSIVRNNINVHNVTPEARKAIGTAATQLQAARLENANLTFRKIFG